MMRNILDTTAPIGYTSLKNIGGGVCLRCLTAKCAAKPSRLNVVTQCTARDAGTGTQLSGHGDTNCTSAPLARNAARAWCVALLCAASATTRLSHGARW